MNAPWTGREIVRQHVHHLDEALYRLSMARREDEQAGAMYGLLQSWEALEDALAEHKPAVLREQERVNERWQQAKAA
jgi:hypothetical protein